MEDNKEIENEGAPSENVRSLIDEYIEIARSKKNKVPYKRGPTVKLAEVDSLALQCANKIYKHYHKLENTITMRRKKHWKLLNSNVLNDKRTEKCKNVIRFCDKKLDWLSMFPTATGSMRVLKDTFTDNDIFYREKDDIFLTDELLDVHEDIKTGIRAMLNKP